MMLPLFSPILSLLAAEIPRVTAPQSVKRIPAKSNIEGTLAESIPRVEKPILTMGKRDPHSAITRRAVSRGRSPLLLF